MKLKHLVSLFIPFVLVVAFLVPSVSAPTMVLPSSGQIPNGYETPWVEKELSVQRFITLADTYGGSYESIGKSSSSSFGGNSNWDIVLFKFGNPDGGRIMLDAYLHGNEFYGYQVLLNVITWLLTSTDADAVRIRQNNYVLVVPVANYRFGRTDFSVQSSGSNDPGGDGGRAGVNLNRNFSPSWSSMGAGTDSYSGPSADSERESQALINAWTTYQPRVYWNLHQGSGPSTSCTARTTQATTDGNAIHSLLPTIQSQLGLTSGAWSFSVGSNYGQGYAKDGAASRGAVGFLTEIESTWDANPTVKASIDSGVIFKNVKAMVISMARVVEGIPPPPPPPTEITGNWYINDQEITSTTPDMYLSDNVLRFKFIKTSSQPDSNIQCVVSWTGTSSNSRTLTYVATSTWNGTAYLFGGSYNVTITITDITGGGSLVLSIYQVVNPDVSSQNLALLLISVGVIAVLWFMKGRKRGS